MNEEFERRLREARHELPQPSAFASREAETAFLRAVVERPAQRRSVVGRRAVQVALSAGLALAVVALVVVALRPSSSPLRGASGDAACAAVLEFRGHTYTGSGVRVAPIPAQPLGEGVIPTCRDQPDQPADPAFTVEVRAIDGIAPEIALTAPGHGELYIRDDVDLERRPPALMRLLRTPTCDPADEPIALRGPWLGISAADGRNEVDLEPPYDLMLRADESSAPAYERAYLTVRVPARLGRPLDRGDLRDSLWQEGQISIVASCRTGEFVAERVEALPPR
jgi:hypothetical protein